MNTSRRKFLKTTIVAGAGAALPSYALASGPVSRENQPATSSESAAEMECGASEEFAYTRGVGVYPGAPAENFSPELVLDSSGTYRNLALLRPAFHSSSYDYNLTAQLVTDGIKHTELPNWVVCVVDGETLSKSEREDLINHFPEGAMELPGAQPAVELHVGGGGAVPEVDRIGLFVVVPEYVQPETLTFTAFVSDDGHAWKKVGSAEGSRPMSPENYPPDLVRGAHVLAPSIPFGRALQSRYYRVEFSAGKIAGAGARPMPSAGWRLGQVEFYRGSERVEIGGPYSFTSAWKSAGMDEEWVYVDLGASFTFDRVALHWIARAAEGKIQVSDDAVVWNDVMPLPANSSQVDDLHLSKPGRGRYVRVLMTRPLSVDGYILSEMEVYGRGGFVVRPKSVSAGADGGLNLAGGAWRLHRGGANKGEEISSPGFVDGEWVVATVPGTVLTSYLNVGAIPDPNYGQNQLQISDSFFYSDFWYRTEFVHVATGAGEITWLNFDGVNWKVEVFLNGEKLGVIDGGFMRGSFDVSGKLHAGRVNALAVRVLKNATPGSCKQKTFESTGKNGGGLGADNPTYHASIGWDWIPTIRGRNSGIWGDVYLTTAGEVTLEDPLIASTLPLPDTSYADVSIKVFAVNSSARSISGILRGRFGSAEFAHSVTVAPHSRLEVALSPATQKALRIQSPQLWWPAGYGEPHLYDVELRFEIDGKVAHRNVFKAGIRQMTSSEEGGALRLWINGRRFIARGGNWGFGESMLRYRAREYDAAVRYHREMNFTMIRNWVGQIGDDAFYEACDRHGIVVWQDFWLANPWDGPVPDDNAMFLKNARDFILRIRRHACVGLYCGRNEWFPPAPLDKGIRELLKELHPDLHYIGSSADGPVSGHGPYHALDAPFYFQTADTKLHSELGAPNIPTLDSVKAMMPESAMWPQGLDWGLHDFTLKGAQGGGAFRALIDERFGGATNARDWIELAQFVNYDTYRAMFEAQGQHRMGLLLWMSHPCWPSFVWQTYDYYFEPTAAYFGCKKASEPLHIQWNSFADTIEVINYNAGSVSGLVAQVELLNLDGSSRAKKSLPLQSKEDSVITVTKMEYSGGLSSVHFLRLTLLENGAVRSANCYMRGLQQGDYRAIRALGKAQVRVNTKVERRGDLWVLTTDLQNVSALPALMVRAKAVREITGDRILPAIYDDNYITLMPQESRTIRTELKHVDTRGEKPRVLVEGFNVAV
jgi:Exo-beta-D-glucosaminidase Ig-fold domain/F5/8 type C domain/Glycosyl hydrolases family 2/Glycosyl hydrolases family 2, sugar binding domain/TAT (twin-arginine translocation) pathway signal sequence